MAEYRLYSIRHDHFWGCEEICAESDEAAIAEACRREQALPAELWAGARKVKLLEPAGRVATRSA